MAAFVKKYNTSNSSKSTVMATNNMYNTKRNKILEIWCINYYVTPSKVCYLFPEKIEFLYAETYKVSTLNQEGFQVLLHKPCHENVHSARSS